MLVGATAEIEMGGSPTRARTWDLRINSPSVESLILLFHQLLTASAQPQCSSRMQCNAGACKTVQLHFRIQLVAQSASIAVAFRGSTGSAAARLMQREHDDR